MRSLMLAVLTGLLFSTPGLAADPVEGLQSIDSQAFGHGAADYLQLAATALPTPKEEVEARDQESEAGEGAGEKRVWGHPLPIWGQKVIDLGYDLPLPFGLAAAYAHINHGLVLDNLKVAISGMGDPQPVSFVSFREVEDRVNNATVKFDAWLLPFLNLFAIAGYVEGETAIGIDIDLDQAFPLLCGGTCGVRTLNAEPDYSGTVGGLGLNLVGGFRNYFAMLNATWSVAEVDLVPGTEITSLNLSPRIGMQISLNRRGMLAVYTGATYLEYDMVISGTADLPVVGPIDFEIDASEEENWNYLLGANWDITQRWSLQAEVGFGNSRDNVISSLTYRF